jgi:hypothetical protein
MRAWLETWRPKAAARAKGAGAVMDLEPVQRLTRDIKKASGAMTVNQARYFVDAYYALQEYRKAADNQVRALVAAGEPNEVMVWLATQAAVLEQQIRRVLDTWSDSQKAGQWAKSITGIGPVIAAGLLAHIDIRKTPTAGHIWSFAGLNPEMKWQKGAKRPWNANLKTLCWKIGESFVKVSGLESDIYGKVWLERKERETRMNDAGAYAEIAAARVATVGKTTDAYKAYAAGKLPPGHIHARAKRYAVKLFLSHYHHVAYMIAFGGKPPKPYILTQEGGHAHMIEPPNWQPSP